MTIERLAELMNNHEAMLFMEPVPELQELLNLLEPLLHCYVDSSTADSMDEEGVPATIVNYAERCLDKTKTFFEFPYLFIRENGSLDAYSDKAFDVFHSLPSRIVRIKDVEIDRSAADQLNALLSAV